jgi:F0F1-type ATP synthase membrane subunit c/vacuolar-type H+-ATPase subunit K
MSNSDQPTIAKDQRKPNFQFSIAFLLGLTAACAFVLGIVTWTPTSLVLLPLAAAIPAIITRAYRRGRRAFGVSIIGGAVATGIAYGDWREHVARLPPVSEEPEASIFVFLMLAIIGLLAGLVIAALVDKYERTNLPQNSERQASQVSQDE